MDNLAGAWRSMAGILSRPGVAIVSLVLWAVLVLGVPGAADAEVPAGPEEVLTPAELQEEHWEKELPEAVEDGWVKGRTLAAPAVAGFPAAVIPESERAAEKMPYNGGNVQSGEIHAYVIFWGSKWNQDPGGKEHVLDMFRYINGSPWTGILTRCFDRTGDHPSGQVALTSYTDTTGLEVPQSITVESIEAEVKKSIQSQGWPTGFDNTYVVLPAVGATEGPGFGPPVRDTVSTPNWACPGSTPPTRRGKARGLHPESGRGRTPGLSAVADRHRLRVRAGRHQYRALGQVRRPYQRLDQAQPA